MAKIVQLRQMSDEKLQEKLENNRDEMFNLRFQHAAKQLKDPMRMRQVRREIAQLETVLHNRQQAIEVAAAHPAVAEKLQGHTWRAEATFSYEDSAWQVKFQDANGGALCTALVNLNKSRKKTRRARAQSQAVQLVQSYTI